MKHLKVLLFTIAFMCFMPSVFADVSVFVDDLELSFSEQPPIIVNDRVLVPMRKIFEELGAYVEWMGETNTVFASKRFENISLSIGESEYYINGEAHPLDSPAVIREGRTLVPVRVVAESLGAEVIWDGENARVLIYTKQGDYIVSDRYIDYWECADDGAVIMTGRTAYPEIQSDEAVAIAFNDFFVGDAEENVLNKRMQYQELAKLSYDEYGENHIPFMMERSFDITYNSDNVISILFADSDFSGGFHPDYIQQGVTYNMETGKRVDCTEIIDEDITLIRKNVKNKFSAVIEETPEAFYSDAKECLDTALNELKWYYDEDGIHFFLNPYEIAPYARGVIDIIY